MSSPGRSLPVRVLRAFWGLPRERRLAAVISIGLIVTLFLPWYSETAFAQAGHAKLGAASTTVSGWGAFTWVEAAILIIAGAVLWLLFMRAEGRTFQLPGGDGWAVTIAGAWTVCLVVWRMFDRTKPSGTGVAGSSGIEWGIVVALLLAVLLTVAGRRMRAAGDPPTAVITGYTAPAPVLVRTRQNPGLSAPIPVDPVLTGQETPAPDTAATIAVTKPPPSRRVARAPTPEPPRPRVARAPTPAAPPRVARAPAPGGAKPPARAGKSRSRLARHLPEEDRPTGWLTASGGASGDAAGPPAPGERPRVQQTPPGWNYLDEAETDISVDPPVDEPAPRAAAPDPARRAAAPDAAPRRAAPDPPTPATQMHGDADDTVRLPPPRRRRRKHRQ